MLLIPDSCKSNLGFARRINLRVRSGKSARQQRQASYKFSLQILTILMTMSVLVACRGDTEFRDLKQKVNIIRSKKPEPIPPLPSFKTTETYKYSAEVLRSPFAPTSPRKGDSPNANRPKEPLEAFPLDGLRMAGTLMEGDKRWAIIVAPNGVTYYVTKGNYMGQNYGRIVKIDTDKIELIETIQGGGQGWLERPGSLLLTESK